MKKAARGTGAKTSSNRWLICGSRMRTRVLRFKTWSNSRSRARSSSIAKATGRTSSLMPSGVQSSGVHSFNGSNNSLSSLVWLASSNSSRSPNRNLIRNLNSHACHTLKTKMQWKGRCHNQNSSLHSRQTPSTSNHWQRRLNLLHSGSPTRRLGVTPSLIVTTHPTPILKTRDICWNCK
jgi:hypothetical protein